jgi:3-phosphoshikimate 1-carboxyvinyltransferase
VEQAPGLIDILKLPLAQLPHELRLAPVPRWPRHRRPTLRVRPPGSKSLTNRALLLAALAEGTSTIRNALLDADDAQRMLAAIGTLGAGAEQTEANTLRVRGVAGCWNPSSNPAELNLNNAGTATRFLAAAAVLSRTPIIIDGNARMRQRPIAELADVLPLLGARVEYTGEPGFPPLRIIPPRALGKEPAAPRVIELPTTQSSQFISALLLIAPWLSTGVTLRLQGEVTSRSYIQMTLGQLASLGASVRNSADLSVIRVGAGPVPPGAAPGLPAFTHDVEPDASGATYFWAAAAILPGLTCRVQGIGADSLQGDSDFPVMLERMGVDRVPAESADPELSVDGPDELAPTIADMSDMPDAAMSLAAVACFAKGTTVLRGLRTLRVKETDRIEAMRTELSKLGVTLASPVAGDADALSITPPVGGIDCTPSCPTVVFDTYDDHRMAMSLALIGLRRPNVVIRDPGCVAKTYPAFWRDYARLHELV